MALRAVARATRRATLMDADARLERERLARAIEERERTLEEARTEHRALERRVRALGCGGGRRMSTAAWEFLQRSARPAARKSATPSPVKRRVKSEILVVPMLEEGVDGASSRGLAAAAARASSPPARESKTSARKAKKTSDAVVGAKRKKMKGSNDSAKPGRKMTDEEMSDCYALMHHYADLGDLEMCEKLRVYFLEKYPLFVKGYEWDHELVACIARDGRRPLETLQWALENGARMDARAALFAVERTPHPLRRDDQGNYVTAVQVLEFLHGMGVHIDEDTLYVACEFGELDCVIYMNENVPGCRVADWPMSRTPSGHPNNLLLVAAKNGHLAVCRYLYENDCDFSTEDAEDCVDQVMNRVPSSPLFWHEIVRWVQSTPEYRELRPGVDFERPLG